MTDRTAANGRDPRRRRGSPTQTAGVPASADRLALVARIVAGQFLAARAGERAAALRPRHDDVLNLSRERLAEGRAAVDEARHRLAELAALLAELERAWAVAGGGGGLRAWLGADREAVEVAVRRALDPRRTLSAATSPQNLTQS